MDVIAEAKFDVANDVEKLCLRIGRPVFEEKMGRWCCSFELSSPLNVTQVVYGEHSLQALFLALKIASSYLYGSRLYRDGLLGAFGEFGGDLYIPAPKEFADVAPYPF